MTTNFVEQRLDRCIKPNDGFGLAWFADKKWSLYKQPVQYSQDPNMDGFVLELIQIVILIMFYPLLVRNKTNNATFSTYIEELDSNHI